MAVTLFGSVSRPTTENQTTSTSGDSIGPTLSLTPPASMQAGDLVFVSVLYRSTSGTLGVTTTGGQTWTSGTQRNQSNARLANFWCVFNGTWTENPVFGLASGTSPLEATMLVFRSDLSNPLFTVDVAETGGTVAAPSTPFDTPSPQLTGAASGALAIAVWGTADDNDWTGQTADWTYGRWRNQAGTDQSLAWAYRVLPSTGNYTVTHRQSANGGDAYARTIISFQELSAAAEPIASTGNSIATGSATVTTTAFGNACGTLALATGLAVLSVSGGADPEALASYGDNVSNGLAAPTTLAYTQAPSSTLASGSAQLTLIGDNQALVSYGGAPADGFAAPTTLAYVQAPASSLASGTAQLSMAGEVLPIASEGSTLADGTAWPVTTRFHVAPTSDVISAGEAQLGSKIALVSVGAAIASATADLTFAGVAEPLYSTSATLSHGVAALTTLAYGVAPSSTLADGSATLGFVGPTQPLESYGAVLVGGVVGATSLSIERAPTSDVLAHGAAQLSFAESSADLYSTGIVQAAGSALLTQLIPLTNQAHGLAMGSAQLTQVTSLVALSGLLSDGRASLTQRTAGSVAGALEARSSVAGTLTVRGTTDGAVEFLAGAIGSTRLTGSVNATVELQSNADAAVTMVGTAEASVEVRSTVFGERATVTVLGVLRTPVTETDVITINTEVLVSEVSGRLQLQEVSTELRIRNHQGDISVVGADSVIAMTPITTSVIIQEET